jgi:FMN-dependent NADH-azoreductase
MGKITNKKVTTNLSFTTILLLASVHKFVSSKKLNLMSKKILHIISSPRNEASVTKKLGNVIIEKIQDKYPGSVVTERNLVTSDFPHLNESQIGAWFTPNEQRTPEQLELVKLSDDAIAEILDADIYVIDAPFYNFSIPSSLKAYLDHIVRGGITFRVNEQGQFEGLLTNKKAYIATASSGVYTEGPLVSFDYMSPYMKFILGFLGVEDVSFVRVQGLRLEGIKETAFETGVASIAID